MHSSLWLSMISPAVQKPVVVRYFSISVLRGISLTLSFATGRMRLCWTHGDAYESQTEAYFALRPWEDVETSEWQTVQAQKIDFGRLSLGNVSDFCDDLSIPPSLSLAHCRPISLSNGERVCNYTRHPTLASVKNAGVAELGFMQKSRVLPLLFF